MSKLKKKERKESIVMHGAGCMPSSCMLIRKTGGLRMTEKSISATSYRFVYPVRRRRGCLASIIIKECVRD